MELENPAPEMTESERRRAHERFKLLQPNIEEGVSLKKLAEQCGRHPKTLRRWMRAYQSEGLRGLARKARSDRGTSKGLPVQLRQLVEGLALQDPAPSITAIHRQAIDVATKQGWAAPSYSCVYKVIKQLDPALVCLAVDGDKAYREQYDLIHRREADCPNEIWQADHTLLDIWLVDDDGKPRRPWLTCINECRAVFYTPTVANTPRQIENRVESIFMRFNCAIDEVLAPKLPDVLVMREWVELLIVDEADRLKFAGLEQIRDMYDRVEMGLVLVGMPGIEKRLARYPQLYSRVGFVHRFKVLSTKEMRFILQKKWETVGRILDQNDFTDEETVSAILRITGGNFRLLDRLLAQVERALQINELQTVTKEVVEAARESLVIGAA